MNDNVLKLASAVMPPAEDDAYLCLLAQIERLDLLLQRRLHQLHERAGDERDMQGFMLAPDEVVWRLQQPQGMPHWALQRELAELEAPAARHVCTGISRLEQLVARFGLSGFESDVLLLSALPLFDARYLVMFSFLQHDPQKKWPTPDLALDLLCPDMLERARQQPSLAPQAPLFYHGMLTLRGKNAQLGAGGDAAYLHIDPALYHYLIGHDGLPNALRACAQWLAPLAQLPDPHPAFTERLVQACFPADAAAAALVTVRGHRGSARHAMLGAAAAAGRRALWCDLAQLPEEDSEAWPVLLLALRETRLWGACLVVASLDSLAEQRNSLCERLTQHLGEQPQAVASLLDAQAPLVWLGALPQLVLELPQRSPAENAALLRSRLARLRAEEVLDVEALARRFHMYPDTLAQTLQEADLYRAQRSPAAGLSNADLQKAFRLRAQQNFGKLAQRVEPRRSFGDLVVSDEAQLQLREILAAIRHRDYALEQGFAGKVNYGLGISALFYGDSGTGKTMAAEVLAGAIGVDLIKIDLSTVVNKYIGETEKNLSRIFDLAAADAGVLFFDEADALFGKRSEAKDAHDRHANIEVSYLLQRLESYPGLVVLATNNRSHLDDAFSRRLTFITRFSFPDAALRERMWRAIWPPQLRLAADIDFARLARKAEITGANIRNSALLATWLAREEGADCMAQAHIDLALKRELSKIGRIASTH